MIPLFLDPCSSNTHSFHSAFRNQVVVNSFGNLENNPMFPWLCSQTIRRLLYLSVCFSYQSFYTFSHIYSSKAWHHQPPSLPLFSLPSLLCLSSSNSVYLPIYVSLSISLYLSLLLSLIISSSIFAFKKCWAPRYPCEGETILTNKTDMVSILLASCFSSIWGDKCWKKLQVWWSLDDRTIQ